MIWPGLGLGLLSRYWQRTRDLMGTIRPKATIALPKMLAGDIQYAYSPTRAGRIGSGQCKSWR